MSVFASALSLVGKSLAPGRLSILIYHQVLPKPDPMRPSEPSVEVFAWQMALLTRYFTPLSLNDALLGFADGTLPPNAVCVTFDDGYLNNLTMAQPILAKYGIPATVYVATAFSCGANMWNDRVLHLFSDPQRSVLELGGERIQMGGWAQRCERAEACLRQLKYLPVVERLARVNALYDANGVAEQSHLMMSPQQLLELAEAGVEIGAHTVNHPILKELTPEVQHEEIVRSKDQLESWTNRRVKHFAYPNGVLGRDLDETTVALVERAGFDTAVVTNGGTSTVATSPYLWRRFTPWDRTANSFHLRMLGNQLRR